MTKAKRVLSPEGQERIRLAGLREWMDRALAVHEDHFDYSRAKQQFRTQKGPAVEIFCKTHEFWFTAKPLNHLRAEGGGCKACDKELASARFLREGWEKFSAWFDENCADRLEIRSTFKGMNDGMDFYCKVHRTVSSYMPSNMLYNGASGCTACSRERRGKAYRLTLDKVLESSREDLPDHVSVLNVSFDESERASKILIRCDWHGEQRVTNGTFRRSPHKCPKCAKQSIGYTGHRLKQLIESGEKGREAILGVMEVEVFGIRALKVGVTIRNLESRYAWYLKQVFFSVKMPEVDAYVLENHIHRQFAHDHDLRILKAGMRAKQRWSGDTECYWFRKKTEIISFIQSFSQFYSTIDYTAEAKRYEVMDFFPRGTSREKKDNQPIPVVGVDPRTKEIVRKFASISDAARAGYRNVSTVIDERYSRQFAGGLQWFREGDYDGKVVPDPIPRKKRVRAVRCLETGEIFPSITEAAEAMVAEGRPCSSSHLTSVCKGKRKTAAGYRWAYAE